MSVNVYKPSGKTCYNFNRENTTLKHQAEGTPLVFHPQLPIPGSSLLF
ncbi:hypothetical protein L798_05810 [Zootermopsis nevadensis]|uniref:Uncharacterized protein n=1 Tax=Zootermopsis nevadensis TaxID=136037 RepID=A0A067RHV4_ZOONE|nr:hypothetical protein L798_05810 [Zootermopsis nevadensis]